MAVISEVLTDNLIRYYSDAGKYIKQIETGDLYIDAVDTTPCIFTYEETNEEICVEEA